MRTITRVAAVATGAATALALSAPAMAHECVNVSKQNQDAGVQIVFDVNTGEVAWMSTGLSQRVDRGLVDLNTGEGFSGLLGFDADGDGAADLSTWIVGPTGEIPTQAQDNGAECHGVVYWDAFFECNGLPIPS